MEIKKREKDRKRKRRRNRKMRSRTMVLQNGDELKTNEIKKKSKRKKVEETFFTRVWRNKDRKTRVGEEERERRTKIEGQEKKEKKKKDKQ